MEFVYQGNSLKSGIYKITNKINNKIYIGSCKEFKRRASQHFSSLKNNKHQNKHLQASFNKHGSEAFIFEAIEVVVGDRIQRTQREKELLDEQINLNNWENCFNFQKNPIRNERSCYSKNPEETKMKQSIAHMGNKNMLGKKQSKETIEKRILKTRGRTMDDALRLRLINIHTGSSRSDETKKKMSDLAKKRWLNKDYREKNIKNRCNLKNSIPVIAIKIDSNEKIEFVSIIKASEGTKLSVSQIRRILTKKCKNPRSWKFQYILKN